MPFLSLFSVATARSTLRCAELLISQVLFSPFAGGLHLLSCSGIKQQREKTPDPPASHMAGHNSAALLWFLFASGSGEELTEPWPHLPPPPPILHLQELGLPVVWQEFCKHVPQSASPRLPPPLAREETPQPGMWKGISMALMRSGSFFNPWDSSCQPSGTSCPTWCRAGTVPKWHQGWFPAWGCSAGSIPDFQPRGHLPRVLVALL